MAAFALLLGLLGAAAAAPHAVPALWFALPVAHWPAVPLVVFAASLAITAVAGSLYLRAVGLAAREAANARHDPLTGAANRLQLNERLALVMDERSPSYCLIELDLDGFKSINDTYGHDAGDLVLSAITATFRETTRARDVVARLGGDEFAVLLVGVDRAGAEAIGEALLEAVRRFRVLYRGQHLLSVGASMSMAMIDRPGTDVDEFRKRIDKGTYAAKQAGKDALFAVDGYADSDPVRVSKPRAVSVTQNAPPSAGTPAFGIAAERVETPETLPRVLGSVLMQIPAAPGAERRDAKRRGAAVGARSEPLRHLHLVLGEPEDPGLAGLEPSGPPRVEARLLEEIAARDDGGARYARVAVAHVLAAAMRVSDERLGRIAIRVPMPARAAVLDERLGAMLAEPLALASRRPPNLALVLHGVRGDYRSAALKQFVARMKIADVSVALAVEDASVGSLAAMTTLGVRELHLGGALMRTLAPGTDGRAAVDTLLALLRPYGCTFVGTGIDTAANLKHAAALRLDRLEGPAIRPPGELADTLVRLAERPASEAINPRVPGGRRHPGRNAA